MSQFTEAIQIAAVQPAVGRINSFGFSGTIAHGLVSSGFVTSPVQVSALAHGGFALEAR